jgi:hypothetical protein
MAQFSSSATVPQFVGTTSLRTAKNGSMKSTRKGMLLSALNVAKSPFN